MTSDEDHEKNMTHFYFDHLKCQYLGDEQLIRLIGLVQQELDQRYPIDVPQNLKCPSCGQTEEDFWTSCQYVAVVNLDNAYVPADYDGSPTWGPKYGCLLQCMPAYGHYH